MAPSKDMDLPVEASFTPRELVGELDRYIVGQNDAKKAVAIALRNRWRRRQVPQPLRDEITPKNIILIGSTGVGKTEIARRISKLARAPFVTVEASKYTEVGYVGRDVDSMVRDLVETAVALVRKEEREAVLERARASAQERVLDLLAPKEEGRAGFEAPPADTGDSTRGRTRQKLRAMLESGAMDERKVTVETAEKTFPTIEIFTSQGGVEEMGGQLQEMLGGMMPKKQKKKELFVGEAIELFTEEEVGKLLDQERIVRVARTRAEETGIVFIDEIAKSAGRERSQGGPDVSREGVQRDLLPIVEGSTVPTKYGPVKTDHILFIAAGAFHVAKVTDLIPELQGRFPIRVELTSLGEDDLLRVLTEPENSLPKQYQALLGTEGLDISFDDGALRAIAEIAAEVNRRTENIGARRLHTVMEKLLEDLSFKAPELPREPMTITESVVRTALGKVLVDQDLERYIL